MDNLTAVIDRGKTWYGATATIDTTYGTNTDLEGLMHVFPDTDPSDRTKRRSQREVHAILVRNVSGITLMKSLAVTWATGYFGKRVDGYTKVTNPNAIAGVVDDHLGSRGVRNGDLFWLIVKGPCLVRTQTTLSNVIAEAQIAYAATAAASTAKTTGGTTADDAGCFCATNVATNLGDDYVLNKLGIALEAATSGQTNTERLVGLDIRQL